MAQQLHERGGRERMRGDVAQDGGQFLFVVHRRIERFGQTAGTPGIDAGADADRRAGQFPQQSAEPISPWRR